MLQVGVGAKKVMNAQALLAMLAVICAAVSSPAAAQDRVFDVHVHLRNGQESIDEYRRDTQDLALAGFAGMWFGGPNQALQGQPDAIRAANDAALALGRGHADFIPVVTVHPYDGRAALRELTRVAGLGAKILKIHPHTQRFDAADPRVLALVQHAGELGLIVLMDNANILPGDSEKLLNLALAAPNTRFIFAHMGAMNFRFWNILALARTADNLVADNIYFDISGVSFLAADSPIEAEFIWTLRNVGVQYILLGSDYPQLSLANAVEALEKLDLTEEEREQIRFGNAQRLFNLQPRN